MMMKWSLQTAYLHGAQVGLGSGASARAHLNETGSCREVNLIGADNTTPLGGSLPRRSQRPGRKNSLSQRPCVRDQGEPYSNRGFRLWSI